MTLFHDSRGRGRNVLLLHGWGMHSGIFDTVMDHLSAEFRVTRADLPGHGRSAWDHRVRDIEGLVEAVLPAMPRVSALIGWSLGGMVAMSLATRYPERVSRLVLVATTPRFSAGGDWPCGMDKDVLEEFATKLDGNYRQTVLDFLTLQTLGDSRARATLKEMRHTVFKHGEPVMTALRTGLDILRHTDLRTRLKDIRCPTLIIAGQHDRVTPAEASRRMTRVIPDSDCAVIPRAGHAPFLSHEKEFMNTLLPFLGAAVGQGARAQ